MQIDWWTFALQVVNVLVLLWLLAHFFFRPVARMISARQAATQKVLDDAAAAREAAEKERAALELERRRQADARDAAIASARAAGEKERAAILADAAAKAAKARSEAEAAVADAVAAGKAQMLTHAGELSVTIAQRLLSQLPPEALAEAFGEKLARALEGLDTDGRARLGEAAARGALELASAAPLTDAEQARISARICDALGVAAQLKFAVAPELIGGLELRGPSVMVRDSWSAVLERVRAEMARGGVS